MRANNIQNKAKNNKQNLINLQKIQSNNLQGIQGNNVEGIPNMNNSIPSKNTNINENTILQLNTRINILEVNKIFI